MSAPVAVPVYRRVQPGLSPWSSGKRRQRVADKPCYYCLSSAVVAVLPGRIAEVAAAIERMLGPEIHAIENSRIVIVIEGESADELGGLLTVIGNLDGVIAANMVFEHIEEVRSIET